MKVITMTTKTGKIGHALFASSLRRKYVMSKDILDQPNFTLMLKGANYMYIHVHVHVKQVDYRVVE